MGQQPTMSSLSQSVKAEDLLKEERKQIDDCTSCRVIGGTAFLALGAYSYWEGTRQLEANRAAILKSRSFIGMGGRRMGLAGISLGMCWMGIYRLFA